MLTRVIKDLFPRYKTMCGYYVRAQSRLGHARPSRRDRGRERARLHGKTEIEKYGVEPFVRKCMDSVFRYTKDWEQLTEDRLLDRPERRLRHVPQELRRKRLVVAEGTQTRDLLYKGHKILPWCPHCQTALSQPEVGQGYQEVDDPSVFVTFRDVDRDTNKTSFLAWTTTPWTLGANVALAVNAGAEYALIRAAARFDDPAGPAAHYIMAARSCRPGVRRKPVRVEAVFPGSRLSRRDLSTGDARLRAASEDIWAAYRVLADDFVSIEDGTGIVHIAAAFGDLEIGRKNGLPTIFSVDLEGKVLSASRAHGRRPGPLYRPVLQGSRRGHHPPTS